MSPMSKPLLRSMVGAFTEFERSIIKRRQKEGIALAKERSPYTGRQRTVSDETPQKVKEMVEQGIPLDKVAAKNHISRSTVYRYLKFQAKEN